MLTRRDALQLSGVTTLAAGAAGVGIWLSGRSDLPKATAPVYIARKQTVPADPSLPEMSTVQGDDPRQLVRRTIDELGGIRRFISRGDVVAIKPNASWDRTPEQAANTNPNVVAEMVRLCFEAGAKQVTVADASINEPHRCLQRSGIGEAARREGADVVLSEERRFRPVDLHGNLLRVWPVFEPFLAADKVINIPIAKHHSLTGATLGIKNWYGILGGQRQRLHQRIHESLADLANFMRPTLTIIDAWRILTRGGPSGGNLEDVALKKTLIAGTNPAMLDAHAAKLWWNLRPEDLLYLLLLGYSASPQ